DLRSAGMRVQMDAWRPARDRLGPIRPPEPPSGHGKSQAVKEDLPSVKGPDRTSAPESALLDVFQLFPYGLVLLDNERRVLKVNDAGEEMFGPLVTSAGKTTLVCCELFGCRQPGGPLEHGCLSELAQAANAPLPEIRVDLPRGASMSAAWAMAAPFESGS